MSVRDPSRNSYIIYNEGSLWCCCACLASSFGNPAQVNEIFPVPVCHCAAMPACQVCDFVLFSLRRVVVTATTVHLLSNIPHEMQARSKVNFNDRSIPSSFLFAEEITTSFNQYGALVVDWPHKAESKSYFPPKGYAFLLFQVGGGNGNPARHCTGA